MLFSYESHNHSVVVNIPFGFGEVHKMSNDQNNLILEQINAVIHSVCYMVIISSFESEWL